jgi:hypothetical protein
VIVQDTRQPGVQLTGGVQPGRDLMSNVPDRPNRASTVSSCSAIARCPASDIPAVSAISGRLPTSTRYAGNDRRAAIAQTFS